MYNPVGISCLSIGRRVTGPGGTPVHARLDAREHRGVRRQRRGVADGQRVVAIAAAAAQKVVPLEVQRRHRIGAQAVFADDEDVVDLELGLFWRQRLVRRHPGQLQRARL